MSPPRIVVLDRDTLPCPIPAPKTPHQWQEYPRTSPAEVVSRLAGATVAITNKVLLQREHLQQLPQLRLIAVSATGYNIIDAHACRDLGIAVCNVPAYSTAAVAEHTLMLMLALRHRLQENLRASANWHASPLFCIFGSPIAELRTATVTLIGGGSIGQRVAELCSAFGATVIRAERRGATTIRPGHTEFHAALRQADILSLHCPYTPETHGLIGAAELALLPAHAVIINTARGGLIDETALAAALAEGRLAGAGLDVLEQEPPAAQTPLLQLQHNNLLLTPHIAWSSTSALERLVGIVSDNIDRFLAGTAVNRVI